MKPIAVRMPGLFRHVVLAGLRGALDDDGLRVHVYV